MAEVALCFRSYASACVVASDMSNRTRSFGTTRTDDPHRIFACAHDMAHMRFVIVAVIFAIWYRRFRSWLDLMLGNWRILRLNEGRVGTLCRQLIFS
jgi:hypothetical protein